MLQHHNNTHAIITTGNPTGFLQQPKHLPSRKEKISNKTIVCKILTLGLGIRNSMDLVGIVSHLRYFLVSFVNKTPVTVFCTDPYQLCLSREAVRYSVVTWGYSREPTFALTCTLTAILIPRARCRVNNNVQQTAVAEENIFWIILLLHYTFVFFSFLFL